MGNLFIVIRIRCRKADRPKTGLKFYLQAPNTYVYNGTTVVRGTVASHRQTHLHLEGWGVKGVTRKDFQGVNLNGAKINFP